MDDMLVSEYYDQDAAPTQKSNKQSKLEQFMSLASTARRPPAGSMLVTDVSLMIVQCCYCNYNNRLPSTTEREADNADTCFDVCALCWGQGWS